jgi:mono/diheme cytochrome c family protein
LILALREAATRGGLALRRTPRVDPLSHVNSIMRAWLMAVRGCLFALLFAPALASAEVNPQLAAKGEEVYSDYCWTCHGEKLRNPGGGTSFDLRRLKPEDYARFVNSVLNGKNTMPPWRGVLDEAQIDAIWAYIRATVDR